MELQELNNFYPVGFHPITIYARTQRVKIPENLYFIVRL
jgi:hypothetical protein